MRTVLPDEKTQSTNIETMSRKNSIIRLIIFSVFIVVASLCSFLPNNTRYLVSKQFAYSVPSHVVSSHGIFSDFDALDSFAVVSIKPIVLKSIREAELSIEGTSILYNNKLQPVSNRNISMLRKVKCEDGVCDHIIIEKYNWVDFHRLIISCTIKSQTYAQILHKADIYTTSLDTPISVIFFILITIFTVYLSFVLVFIVPKRLYPTRLDHWSTIYLGLAAICLDGPWLILKYYSSYFFNMIYDIMPEIYHVVFVLFIMSFFNAMTHGWPNRIFGSWIIGIIIASCLVCIMVLEAIITQFTPFNTVSIFIKENYLRIPLYTFTATTHLIIIVMIVVGIATIQIQNDSTLILVSTMIVFVEALDILRLILRFWTPMKNIGFSFASDVLYIIVANFVTAFFLSNNLPFSKAINNNFNEDLGQEILPNNEDVLAEENEDLDTTNI